MLNIEIDEMNLQNQNCVVQGYPHSSVTIPSNKMDLDNVNKFLHNDKLIKATIDPLLPSLSSPRPINVNDVNFRNNVHEHKLEMIQFLGIEMAMQNLIVLRVELR